MQLREGNYTGRAKSPGFQEYALQDVQLVALDLRRLGNTKGAATLPLNTRVHSRRIRHLGQRLEW